ncbi:phospholipase D1 [Heterostelium album PN500]|uniref:phospholipase D n=1 Tax=Heterostelium pallidum (strain ATCC 26659 / Pp 5 / PN500) TaxID=670386 RepID=D3BH77_HETP5|nr:phospholipase D1 [Heterostelium album PN500]EFA79461.1 phospholipase D1 [Heterostelium album PN500]|eukprot:XP_020431582.1 phospholipase D1 [Heterostelium album PN500]
MVSRDEVYQVVSTMSRIFSKLPFTKERYISPHEVVAAVFNGGLTMNGSGYLQDKDELSLPEFIDRGLLDADLSRCFGIGNYSRYFFVKSREEADDWVNAIRHYSRIGYRFQSFAQPQPNNTCQWFVNGVNYYRELAKAIESAQYEILLTGWWVWPYVILDRDTPERMLATRLDRLLTKKAKDGVKVHVLMWNETNVGVQLGTKHASKWLENCHPNIQVIRHPKIYPLSWSHHQKSVIIDQLVGFVGGIDICFMRYETDDFPLIDLDSKLFPGKDYGNICSTVIRTGNPHKDQLNRHEVPRMPWHDVHIKVVGLSAKDLAANFIQRWNHAKTSDKHSNWGKDVLLPKDYLKEHQKTHPNGFFNALSDLKRNVTNIGYGTERRTIYHRPVDNPEVRKHAADQAKKYINPIDNSIGYDGISFNEIEAEDDDNSSEIDNTPVNVSTPASITKNANVPECLVQIVRSACLWSVGADTESSCYKAYITTIRNAKHFVYIQNLFFVSSCGARLPKNRIALALLQRIRHAIINKTNFKVIVVTSINAGGDVRDPAARVVIGWTQRTINKGGQSIVELLQKEFPDVDLSQYFGVYSLRKWETCFDRVYTEQIYIHSKVLIADDKVAIIGSCNINDRSMMGVRDSELAAVVTDSSMVETRMDGRDFMAGEFSRSLRMSLWKLHLGLSDSEVTSIIDPVASYEKVWVPTAKNNTLVYKDAFGDFIPENQVRLPLPDDPCLRYVAKRDELLNTLSRTKGFVVEYPLNMYSESNLLSTNLLTPEHYYWGMEERQTDYWLIEEGDYLKFVPEIPLSEGYYDFSKAPVIRNEGMTYGTFFFECAKSGTQNVRNGTPTSFTQVTSQPFYDGHPFVADSKYFRNGNNLNKSPAIFRIEFGGIIHDNTTNCVFGNIDGWAGPVTEQTVYREVPILIHVAPNVTKDGLFYDPGSRIYGYNGYNYPEYNGQNNNKMASIKPVLNANEQMMVQSFATQYQACLANCDLNRDNNIDKNELIQILVRSNTPYDQALNSVNKIFQTLDVDNNGVINFQDIIIYNNTSQQPQQPQQPGTVSWEAYNRANGYPADYRGGATPQPAQQPQQSQQQNLQGQLQPYNGMQFQGFPIFKKGQLEEYYAMVNGAYKQINWLRDNFGGGQWVKVGWVFI